MYSKCYLRHLRYYKHSLHWIRTTHHTFPVIEHVQDRHGVLISMQPAVCLSPWRLVATFKYPQKSREIFPKMSWHLVLGIINSFGCQEFSGLVYWLRSTYGIFNCHLEILRSHRRNLVEITLKRSKRYVFVISRCWCFLCTIIFTEFTIL